MGSSSFNRAITDLSLCDLLLNADISEVELSEVATTAQGLTNGQIRQLARRTRDRFVDMAKRHGLLGDRRFILDGTLSKDGKVTSGEKAAESLLAKYSARDESGALLIKPPVLRRAS